MAENRLSKESSTYLKGAAHQPVQWYPWGEDAFRRAKELDRPILLDIGATWCHWCHVIDRESYEDPDLAAVINDRFVAIKVDRDERPAIDARYQQAVGAIAGQGGWPLTIERGKRACRKSSPARCRRWRKAGYTTRSAGASIGTRRTRGGSCRTSRRCCTTTRASWQTTFTHGNSPATLSIARPPKGSSLGPKRSSRTGASADSSRVKTRTSASTTTPTTSPGPWTR